MNMFNSIPLQKLKKSKFNMSHSRKGTCNPGKLVPIMFKEVLPGDSWRQDTQLMARCTPLITPIMHDVDVKVYSFYVPWRIVWSEFKDYITKGRLGTAAPVRPYLTINDANVAYFNPKTLADFLGVQSKVDPITGVIGTPITQPLNVSALPFRAYQEIYNEYFHNDNLSAPAVFGKGSGDSNADIAELAFMRSRQWEADRYVSALPFAQRGDTVIMPVDIQFTYKEPARVEGAAGGALSPGPLTIYTDGHSVVDDLNTDAVIDNIDSIDGTSLDINEFREALALQKWLENNARGGAKYIDQLLVRWGVRSSDARLQRPEYLGGASAPLVISEVLSTAQFENDTDVIPQGNMAGHGIAVGSGNGFSRFFEEHGCVITLMSIIPRTAYMQGVEKFYTREDALDWPSPEFANLGEEPITLGELWYDPLDATHEVGTIFGYTPRFSDLKYSPSTVHGEMRTNLKQWTMAREFDNEPTLSLDFVLCDPTTRIYAVEDEAVDKFYFQVKHRISLIRSLPYYGMPGKMTI